MLLRVRRWRVFQGASQWRRASSRLLYAVVTNISFGVGRMHSLLISSKGRSQYGRMIGLARAGRPPMVACECRLPTYIHASASGVIQTYSRCFMTSF